MTEQQRLLTEKSTYRIASLVIEQTVDYAIQLPDHPPDGETTLLIVLHGYGQTCEKFIKVFAPLRQEKILTVAPQAPHPFYVKLTPKIVGFSWLTLYQRDRAVGDFIGYMRRLIRCICSDFAFKPAQVYFLGFSQGVSMAYRFAVGSDTPPGGVIACGADLPPDVAEKLPQSPKFRVLIAHGIEDTIVPIEKAHAARQELLRQRFPVEQFIFPGGHEIPAEAVKKIGEWIQRP